MEKGKSVVAELAASFSGVQVTPRRKATSTPPAASFSWDRKIVCELSEVVKQMRASFPREDSPMKKARPRKLVSLCIGVLGQHLEDIINDISEFTAFFPPHIKLAIMSIARRRRLLNDDVLVSLVDSSWKILDISGSEVTDVGLATVARTCSNLWAVDISRCEKITPAAVSEIICHCPSLEILRCGFQFDCIVFHEAGYEKGLNPIIAEAVQEANSLPVEDSWEELEAVDFGSGAQSLRWLVWPKIDDNSKEILALECPRVIVNPKPSLLDLGGSKTPGEALASVPLDHSVVEDIDPKTWAVSAAPRRAAAAPPHPSAPPEIPIAERFRLAYVERDARLAPKRARRERQHRRRAERDYLMNDIDAKSIALASKYLSKG
uniref:RNI-like superfamily protein n=1 Tax=Aegilops tauschii TaxID=37682 RepID=M8BX29_AEGTA